MEILGCPLPSDRLYDLEHEVWWQADPPGGAGRLGVVSTLAAFAGPFRELTFRPLSGRIGRGRSVATIESVRFTGAVRLPFDAEVVERNEELLRRPRLLNDRPYDEGWVVRVRPARPDDAGRFLEPADAVRDRVEELVRDRRIRCWPRVPEVELVEVGVECSAVLTHLNDEVARRAPGEALLLVTDDPTSPIEMARWTDQTGHVLLARRTEGPLFQFLIEKLEHPVPRRRLAGGTVRA